MASFERQKRACYNTGKREVGSPDAQLIIARLDASQDEEVEDGENA